MGDVAQILSGIPSSDGGGIAGNGTGGVNGINHGKEKGYDGGKGQGFRSRGGPPASHIMPKALKVSSLPRNVLDAMSGVPSSSISNGDLTYSAPLPPIVPSIPFTVNPKTKKGKNTESKNDNHDIDANNTNTLSSSNPLRSKASSPTANNLSTNNISINKVGGNIKKSSTNGGVATTTPALEAAPTMLRLDKGRRYVNSSKPARKWIWEPFNSSGRNDGLMLHHWVRAGMEYPDYPFARFDVHLDSLDYHDSFNNDEGNQDERISNSGNVRGTQRVMSVTNMGNENTTLDGSIRINGNVIDTQTNLGKGGKNFEKMSSLKAQGSDLSKIKNESLKETLSSPSKNKAPSILARMKAYKECGLQSENWTQSETDTLLELCCLHELRWPVIIDRWIGIFGWDCNKKVEDLQHRYYTIGNIVAKREVEKAARIEAESLGRVLRDMDHAAAASAAFGTPNTEDTKKRKELSIQHALVSAIANPNSGQQANPPNFSISSSIDKHTYLLQANHNQPVTINNPKKGISNQPLFDLQAEKNRRELLEVVWNRSKEEEREEEELRNELRLVETQIRKFKKNGGHILAAQKRATAAGTMSGSIIPSTNTGNSVVPGNAAGGYMPAPSRGISPPSSHLGSQSSSPQPITSLDAPQSSTAIDLDPTLAAFASAAPTPMPGTPYLQSGRLAPPSTGARFGIHKTTLKRMDAALHELKVPERPIPTKRICDVYDGVRKDVLSLLTLQRFAWKKESEVASRRKRLANRIGKDLADKIGTLTPIGSSCPANPQNRDGSKGSLGASPPASRVSVVGPSSTTNSKSMGTTKNNFIVGNVSGPVMGTTNIGIGSASSSHSSVINLPTSAHGTTKPKGMPQISNSGVVTHMPGGTIKGTTVSSGGHPVTLAGSISSLKQSNRTPKIAVPSPIIANSTAPKGTIVGINNMHTAPPSSGKTIPASKGKGAKKTRRKSNAGESSATTKKGTKRKSASSKKNQVIAAAAAKTTNASLQPLSSIQSVPNVLTGMNPLTKISGAVPSPVPIPLSLSHSLPVSSSTSNVSGTIVSTNTSFPGIAQAPITTNRNDKNPNPNNPSSLKLVPGASNMNVSSTILPSAAAEVVTLSTTATPKDKTTLNTSASKGEPGSSLIKSGIDGNKRARKG
mmetsp:Transcript_22691/g.32015  ORF Transcript_22691/g.32015 Transcript_22691/m.32015 type:complete len:1142 (+) Transcript_22691:320-3745(+)